MSDDEKTLRDRLRRVIDGPPADEEQPPAPLVEVHVIPEPTAPEADEDQDETDGQEDEEPEAARPWWYSIPRPFGAPATPDPEPTAQERLAATPGIHVTVHQPPPPPWATPVDPAEAAAAERLHRRRVWVAYHAGAAGVGWVFGLPQQMAELIADAGNAGPAVGIALGLVTWIVASYLPGLPYMPPALRPVTVWAARIPVCSAALALALNAPNAL
ncbi:hypothetical protein ACFRH6_16935 [Streptomyces sp. NPDC056749]|uniref:hypothetical protein n=1 Tax=Streptomyces sp. NPDC056749 TaxID=3345936 RepID=UPI0036CDA185